jgi:c-di-GMP-related signal transduction protein
MDVILAELPLPDEIMAALAGTENQSRFLLDCAIAYERGEFDRCLYLAGRAGLDPKQLPVAHRDALKWAADFKRAA